MTAPLAIRTTVSGAQFLPSACGQGKALYHHDGFDDFERVAKKPRPLRTLLAGARPPTSSEREPLGPAVGAVNVIRSNDLAAVVFPVDPHNAERHDPQISARRCRITVSAVTMPRSDCLRCSDKS